MCGILGDYLASAQALDVMKHMARAPYTPFSFRHRTCQEGLEYAFTTTGNYPSCSISRTLYRTLELR